MNIDSEVHWAVEISYKFSTEFSLKLRGGKLSQYTDRERKGAKRN